MPQRFNMLSTAIWNRDFRQLTGPAKVVFFYVASCRVRVTEGLFELPVGIMLHDTNLKEEHLRQALDELDRAGFVSYDETTEVVLDRTALKYNPLRNGTSTNKETGEVKVKADNRIKSAVNLFAEVPDCPLKFEFVRLAREHSPDLADALVARFGPEVEIVPPMEAAKANELPDDPVEEAPSEPLLSPSEAPLSSSSERASTEKFMGRVCEREGCGEVASWQDTQDGFASCDRHKDVVFGEALPLGGAS